MAGAPMPLPEEDIERHERSGPRSESLAEALNEPL
jgi:aerobic C4-dicarboxylate transport protein